MRDVVAIILGGGRGSRLYPLTQFRAKPAVPLAGKYRLIDIPLSNCINSEVNRIFVLTQFNSASLNRHITRTYRFSIFTGAFVEVLAAQQTLESSNWFQGTADAVRHYLSVFEGTKASDFLILSGDHLYRMDYQAFVAYHRKTDADITVSVHPVKEREASDFGIMKIDNTNRVVEFKEKPVGAELKKMWVNTERLGLTSREAKERPYIASMGIYVFKKDVLPRLLRSSPTHSDFGKEVIPSALKELKTNAFLFNGYWEDIGTIDSFYQANMALLDQPEPHFSFYDNKAPVFTRPRFLPCTSISDSQIENSMIADGCVIDNAEIRHSIIGIRSYIDSGVVIENSIVSGADFYQSRDEREDDRVSGRCKIGIGRNSHIRNTIIDKNVRIGENVKIVNQQNVSETKREDQGYCISNGIVIVIKGSTIPDNTVI